MMSSITNIQSAIDVHPSVADAIVEALSAYAIDSADAMRGQCYSISLQLQTALTRTLTDEDGDEFGLDAAAVQIWDAPAAVSGNPLCAGHWVVRLSCMYGDVYVDATAAQFPELGWTTARVMDEPTW